LLQFEKLFCRFQIIGATDAAIRDINRFLAIAIEEQKPRHRTGSNCLQKIAAYGIAVTNSARY
jgi:hypothetical protein